MRLPVLPLCNLEMTPSGIDGGKLGILDYGLMTTIQPEKRVAFIEYLMHLQAKEYAKCLQAFPGAEATWLASAALSFPQP